MKSKNMIMFIFMVITVNSIWTKDPCITIGCLTCDDPDICQECD
jgi:hypothetical protein